VLKKTVNSFLKKWSIAGASIAIAKDGKLIYARVWICRYCIKTETQLIVNSELQYFKTGTAVGIMKLQEQGKLALPIVFLVPEGF